MKQIITENYCIQKFSNEFAQVIGCSYEHPLEYLDKIAQEPIFEKFEGEVIFDALLSNGYKASNQYIIISLINKKFGDTIKKVDVWKEIKLKNKNNLVSLAIKNGFAFWSSNLNILENGILTKEEIKDVKFYCQLWELIK